MIDVKKYTLTYFKKEDGKEVKAFIPERGQVNILEDGKVLKFTSRDANKIYRPSKNNNKAFYKPPHTRPRMQRRKDGFEDYLNESRDKLVSNFY